MALVELKPFDAGAGAAGTGISISLNETRSGQFVRLLITEAAQKERFGGPLDPEKDTLVLTLSDDPGKTHLMGIELGDIDDPKCFAISRTTRGGVGIRIAPYNQLPNGKVPSKQLQISHAPKVGHVVVKLPEWARPVPRKIGQGISKS